MPAAALLLGGVAGTAYAQQVTPQENQQNQQKPQTLQTIVVTGSHIRRVDLETSNPLVTVTAQQIQATGKLTLGDVIQSLPGITGSGTNPAVDNPGGSGATFVGLRGLGPSRTLILIDGQRVLNRDLNTIPSAAVERIEVLTDGASAIYGSDAIGGVINIILKSNYQGAQFQANYGISDHDDGERKGASFMFGQTSDKGSILAGVSYNKFDQIYAGARNFAKNVLLLTTTAKGGVVSTIGGSANAARDFISVGNALEAKFGCAGGGPLSLNESAFTSGTSPTTTADYHCFGNNDAYNFGSLDLIVTPQERANAFFKGVYHLSDNVDFYATVLHNQTSSAFALAPAIFNVSYLPHAVVISKDSYYNPFKVNFSATSGAGYSARLFPVGNRVTRFSGATDQAMIGLKGNVNLFNQNWEWDAGYNYGRTSDVTTVTGVVNISQIEQDLGPSFMNTDGVVQCGTPSSPIPLSSCTPFDPFNLNSASAKSVLSDAALSALENTWDIEKTFHAGINGGVFDLPAGTAQLAAGVSYRTEYTDNAIDPVETINATGTCTTGSQCTAHLQGGFNVKEAYGELFVPILKDLPFVHALNLTLGDRYSKFSDFGSTNNWKVAMEYRPITDLLLRGTVSKVFRAPTVADIFGSPVSSAPSLNSDPCDHITVANPACVGVPLNGSFVDSSVASQTQINGLNAGSKYLGVALGPESGKSFDFGAVYSPHQVTGLSFTADVWRIYLDNIITPELGAQSVLNLCFAGQSFYCPLITRAQSGLNAGQIIQIIQPTVNLGRLDVKGVDVSANYRLPDFSFGQLTLGLNATYMTQFKIQTDPGKAANQVIEGAGLMGGFSSALQASCPFSVGGSGDCFFPRIRGKGHIAWQLGPWDAQWTMSYMSKFRMSEVRGNDPNEVGVNRYGATVYNDVTAGYNIAPINTRIDIGVDNVFDKQPPMLFYPTGFNQNTDAGDFDQIGRYYWARLTVKF